MARKKTQTLPVSTRALVNRINRALSAKDERLVGRRGRFPSYSRIDVRLGALVEAEVDLDELGRRLGVLQPWESYNNGGKRNG